MSHDGSTPPSDFGHTTKPGCKTTDLQQQRTKWIRFDRNELAGSFGDIGTDLPLIIGLILAAQLDSASVFIVFGLLQIASGLIYGLPMPLQPLKAMAVLVITQKLDSKTLYGAGLVIGLIMLVLTFTGLLDWLTKVIPLCVVRGLQLGLGLSLASLALKDYVPAMGASGYVLAAVSFGVIIALWGNRRFPAALVVIALGMIFALFDSLNISHIAGGIGLSLPSLQVPDASHMWMGLWMLALPQLPLSLSNSVIATHQTLHDLYPKRNISVRRIGLTYSLANLISPWLGGIPTCHGCGGLVGHHTFGARTGGSVIIYGCLYLFVGLFFSNVFAQLVTVFPLPVLGVVLLFEAIGLMGLSRDIALSQNRLWTIMLITAVLAWTLPQGYLVAAVVGSALFYLWPQGNNSKSITPTKCPSMGPPKRP